MLVLAMPCHEKDSGYVQELPCIKCEQIVSCFLQTNVQLDRNQLLGPLLPSIEAKVTDFGFHRASCSAGRPFGGLGASSELAAMQWDKSKAAAGVGSVSKLKIGGTPKMRVFLSVSLEMRALELPLRVGQRNSKSRGTMEPAESRRASLRWIGLPDDCYVARWVWVKIKPPGTAGFGPCFRFPGFHLGYLFLTHSQMLTVAGIQADRGREKNASCASRLAPFSQADFGSRKGQLQRKAESGAQSIELNKKRSRTSPIL